MVECYDETQGGDDCTGGVTYKGGVVDVVDTKGDHILNSSIVQTTPSMGCSKKTAPESDFLRPSPSRDSGEIFSGNRGQVDSEVYEGLNNDNGVQIQFEGAQEYNTVQDNATGYNNDMYDDTMFEGGGTDMNTALPGRNDRGQQDTMEKSMGMDALEVRSMSMNDTDTPGDEHEGMSNVVCTHNRKGYCVIHKVKGDRTEYNHKVWKKKKYGYGYVTCKKVLYSCPLSTDSNHTSGFDVMKTSVNKPTAINDGVVGLSSDNLQRDNVGGTNLNGLKVKGTDWD